MNAVEQAPLPGAPEQEGLTLASQLVGLWTLIGYVEEKPSGENTRPFGLHPQGFLIYTADGFVSAQLMRPGRSPFSSSNWHQGTPEKYQESGSGYTAYCGSHKVDEEEAKVTHQPSVSLLPNLIDLPQYRSIELRGDRLILRAAVGPAANGLSSRLEWKRVHSNIEPASSLSKAGM
jgi:Lipocalin-like domain